MSAFKTFVCAFIITTAAGVTTGCQSGAGVAPTAKAGDPAGEALMCTKCEVTWIKTPVDGGKGRIVGYSSRRAMECPDCRTAVDSFFRTGKLEHVCASCGDSLKHCEMHSGA